MRMTDLNYKSYSGSTNRLHSGPSNIDVAKRKIAFAEGMVDAYDGSLQDRDRKEDGQVTLLDSKSHDVVKVRTDKEGTRHYRLESNSVERGLFTGTRYTTRDLISVKNNGDVSVSLSHGKAQTAGLLTGPLIDERLPRYFEEQTFLFSDPSLVEQ